MKKITQVAIVVTATLIMSACGNSSKKDDSGLGDKKAALEKLKASQTKTADDIQKLQDEISKLDSNADNSKIKLVNVTPVGKDDFKHYIDLQGRIDAENISYIAPRGMPGLVKAIYVRQGDKVRKGQVLLKLDDAIMRQQVATARQGLEGIKTQLALAKDLYNRQKNLWDQGIGTQVQLISAKTNAEALENQLSTANEQVKIAQEQLNTTNVTSDVTGIADIVAIKVGETFSGMTQEGPQIKIVSNNNLKAVANVPENYASRLRIGTPLVINVADVNKSFNSTVSFISQAIDQTSRGFTMEAKIPSDPALKPNLSAVVKILDYSANAAVVIPVNTVQSDEKNKYVFVMEKNEKGKYVAKRKTIELGEVYGAVVEIKSGLTGGEQLVTEGYQNLYEGQLIGTDVK